MKTIAGLSPKVPWHSLPGILRNIQFSLSSLILFVLFACSLAALWVTWAPWQRGTRWEDIAIDYPISLTCLSSGSREFLIGHDDGIDFINIRSGKHVSHLDKPKAIYAGLIRHREASRVAASDKYGNLSLLDCQTRNWTWQVNADSERAQCLAFSDQGTYVFVGGKQGIAAIVDAETGAFRQRMSVGSSPIKGVVAAESSRRVITVEETGRIQLWNLDDGTLVKTLCNPILGVISGKTEVETEMVLMGGGNFAAAAQRGDDDTVSTIHFWYLRTGAEIETLRSPYRVRDAIVASSGGRWLLLKEEATDGHSLFEFGEERILQSSEISVPGLSKAVFSEDETMLLLASEIEDESSVVDLKTLQPRKLKVPGVSFADFAPDSRHFALGVHDCGQGIAEGAFTFKASDTNPTWHEHTHAHLSTVHFVTGDILLVGTDKGNRVLTLVRNEGAGPLSLPELWLSIFFGGLLVARFFKHLRRARRTNV
ncbi:MAG: hypothetical protein L6R28_08735 [Planctomycetes bacterium]|nr:hypothetical protein [Planctomycetota bacterium]